MEIEAAQNLTKALTGAKLPDNRTQYAATAYEVLTEYLTEATADSPKAPAGDVITKLFAQLAGVLSDPEVSVEDLNGRTAAIVSAAQLTAEGAGIELSKEQREAVRVNILKKKAKI